MTSTYPPPAARQFVRFGAKAVEVQEIQSKKDALATLENALKKRLCELRELCLREGELTGQLPSDYPLQPREPIPQVRRRTHYSSSSHCINTILPKQHAQCRTRR